MAQLGAEAFCFVGDDLGDVEAFEYGLRLREQGRAVLLVCSQSGEQDRLADMADLVVPGPDGVVDFLRRLADDAAQVAAR